MNYETLDYSFWEEHCNYFTLHTLSALLVMHGFDIVHHESKNRFHDANYRYSPATQTAINKAFRTIRANPRVSRRTKKHMKIAKQKASIHRR